MKYHCTGLIIVLMLITSHLFSQRIERRDLGYFKGGDFIQDRHIDNNDSFLVVNHKQSIYDDTSFVSVIKIADSLLQVRIYNSFKKLVLQYNTWKYIKEGVEKSFYDSGNLRSETFFILGNFINMVVYHDTGQLMAIQNINRDTRTGKSAGFYKDGRVKWYEFYNDTSQAPLYSEYYITGALKLISYGETDYQTYREYYITGVLKEEGHFRQVIDWKVGKCVEYHSNGKVSAEKEYKFIAGGSFPVGLWIYYNKNGEEIRREVH